MKFVQLVLLILCVLPATLVADNSMPDFDFIIGVSSSTDVDLHDVSGGAAGPSYGVPKVAGAAGAVPVPIYGAAAEGGVWVSVDGGHNWRDISAGLPERVVYPFDRSRPCRIESLAFDPTNPTRVAAAAAHAIYISSNAGGTWREVGVTEPVKSVDHITAVGLSPNDDQTMYIGTSFNGYFKSSDGGKSWLSEKDSVPKLYLGAGFYETITAIAVSPAVPSTIYLAVGIRGEVLQSSDGGKSWESIGAPDALSGESSTGVVHAITFTYDEVAEAWMPQAHVNGNVFTYSTTIGSWFNTGSDTSSAVQRKASPAEVLRRQIAGGRTGIYVNSAWASGDALEEHLALLAEQGMDTIVVDMKDDFGRLTYNSELELAKEAGAVNVRFNLDDLLARAHESGIYVIGRIVAFQDPKLYAFKNNAYAVWDTEKDKPWANLIRVAGQGGEEAQYEQREYWVDPYSEFVWRYNVSIADELETRGIDEVQFDYIRFPSDGETTRIQYRFKREGMTRVDAIESFLVIARERLDIPISTDLYGFNAWYVMGGWIGQNIDMIADYVDVVCPMFYPSHFPGSFLNKLDYLSRAETIYRTGSDRAFAFVGDRCIVRPYVQAFLIGSERAFEIDRYTSYLKRQLDGVVSSMASGFTLWNASNKYYMVTESLKAYTEAGGRP